MGGVEANASTLVGLGRNFFYILGGFGTQGGGRGMPPPHRVGWTPLTELLLVLNKGLVAKFEMGKFCNE